MFSSLKSPTKKMKSLVGCEEIVASSFLSALFTPDKPEEIFVSSKTTTRARLPLMEGGTKIVTLGKASVNVSLIPVVEILRQRSYRLRKYTLLDSEASVQVPERCPVTCRR